jgi:hypothetical protein
MNRLVPPYQAGVESTNGHPQSRYQYWEKTEGESTREVHTTIEMEARS